MSISSIGRTQSLYQNRSLYTKQNQNLHRNFQQLSSGKRIKKAADDAAALQLQRRCCPRAMAMTWAGAMPQLPRIW